MTSTTDIDALACRLVRARLEARALSEYPGAEPPDLAAAYACQERAIALWPDQIAGWKVGIVPEARREELGATHLVGPIFRRQVTTAADALEVTFRVFEGGSAAVEAEYVIVVARDVPPERRPWSAEQAREVAGDLWTAVETAGSPLRGINALGPIAVASDFGNNAGLILGKRIGDWSQSMARLGATTYVDGRRAGRGGPNNVPGGPFASLAGLLELLAGRERWLRAGQLVSTGATTGIHDLLPGQRARVAFDGFGDIRCRAEAAPRGDFS